MKKDSKVSESEVSADRMKAPASLSRRKRGIAPVDDGLVHWDLVEVPTPPCDKHSAVTRVSEDLDKVTCPHCLTGAMAWGYKALKQEAHLEGSPWKSGERCIGSAAHVELWDAINAFTVASGGRDDAKSVARMEAAGRIDRAVEARARELARNGKKR